MRKARSTWVVGVAVAAGCVGGACTSAPSVGTPASTAREILAQPTRMEVLPASSMVQVRAEIDRGSSVDAARVSLAVTRGAAWVRTAGGQVVIDSLAIQLAPVDLPASILPGAKLTDLQLRLPEAARSRDAVWADDDESCNASVTGPLELDWAIELEGKAYPLAPQRIEGVDLAMMIGRDGDAVTLDAGAMGTGTKWTWADIVWFDDLTITVAAETR